MSEVKTVKEVAEDIILSHACDIEYMSIGEAMGCLIDDEELPFMTENEFSEFQDAVDDMICRSVVEVSFAD